MINFDERYEDYVSKIEKALEDYFINTPTHQAKIYESMKYSLMAPGKRIRPILLLEFCRIAGGNFELAMDYACAIEMIHSYSLIHDDLPCMDDDPMRRGMPTNHIVYGESTAVLAGDALLNAAFEVMLRSDKVSPDVKVAAAQAIADASGARGMIGGQILDMENENKTVDAERLLLTDTLKTGALFKAACEAGCILAGSNEAMRQAAVSFAQAFGVSFQIMDDVLDITGSPAELGKSINSDSNKGKVTYVDAYGVDVCKEMVTTLTAQAKEHLSAFSDTSFLSRLIDKLAARRS